MQRAPLPVGWCWGTVDDLGTYVNGLPFKPSEWEATGRPIIRIQNLTDSRKRFNRTSKKVHSDFLVVSGDILVSWSATLDAFIWRGPEAILNQHIFKVVPVRQLPNRTFLYWGLRHAIQQMSEGEHTHGTTMRHINRGPFLAHRFPLGADLLRRQKADRFQQLGFGRAVRIDRGRVASPA